MGTVNRRILTILVLLVLAFLPASRVAAELSDGIGAYRKGDFAAARQELEKVRDQSPLALYLLGIMQIRGEGMPRDMTKGVALLQQAAANGYIAAQYALAVRYLYGSGVRKDPARARQLFAAAVSGRDYRAVAYLQILATGSHDENRDMKAMVSIVGKAARAGKPDAMYTMGLIRLIGDGLPKNAAEEIRWYEAAAAAGSSRASFTLAQMYYYGEGVPRSERRSVEYARRAADQGQTGAMFFLGALYYHGRGVKEDKAKAVFWIRKAAGMGHLEAQHALGMLLFSGEGVAVNKVEGLKWLGKASQQGDEGARDVLRELVAFRGGERHEVISATPGPVIKSGGDKQNPGVATRIEGKAVILEKGKFSLKFSGPDLTDVNTGSTLPASGETSSSPKLNRGKFEIIFRR